MQLNEEIEENSNYSAERFQGSESSDIFDHIAKFFIVIIYIFAVLCYIFPFFYVAINPKYRLSTKKTLELRNSIIIWKNEHYDKIFNNTEMEIKVLGYNKMIKLEKKENDPDYLAIKKFSKEFKYNVALYSYDSKGLEFSYLFGTFFFSDSVVPFGKSEIFCFQIRVLSHYQNKILEYTLINSKYCFLKKLTKKFKAFPISPWIEKKLILNCKSLSSCIKICKSKLGVFKEINQKKYCFQYLILKKICIKVSKIDNSEKIKFSGGCYKNGKLEYLENASPNSYYTFNDITIQIRHEKDPYLTAIKLSDDVNIPFNDIKLEIPGFMFYLDKLGIILFVVAFFFQSILKIEKLKKD